VSPIDRYRRESLSVPWRAKRPTGKTGRAGLDSTRASIRRALGSPIIRFRLASVFAAQLFDFGTFTIMVERHGIRAEANPIVASGFAAFGLPVVALLKIALVILIGSVVVLLGREGPGHRPAPRLAAIVTVFAFAAGIVGGLSNIRLH
jgi:hypothetical protein